MSTQTIFGRIVTGGDVEHWCLDVLRRWSSTYLSEVERQHGMAAGTLARVKAWVTAPTFDKWPEDQLPAVVLLSVGLAEAPVREGDGSYRARWQMGLAVVCSARTQAESHAMAMLYVAAHRMILLQRQSLEGHAAGVDWQDETYDELVFDDVRSLGAGQAVFTVQVDDVANDNSGPVTPDDPLEPETDPWPLWPTVETVDTVVKNEAPSEEEK